jgi:hypothetical protein
MKYQDRTFPYPVFRSRPNSLTAEQLSADDFPTGDFLFDVDPQFVSKRDGNHIELTLAVNTNLKHSDLQEILDRKIAILAVEVRAPATLYRRVHPIPSTDKIDFGGEELFGQVFVTPLVIMWTPGSYAPKQANPEFGDARVYSLEKGDILAIGETTTFNVAFDFSIGDDSVEVLPSDDLPDFEYKIVIVGPAINILVGKKLNKALQDFEANQLGRALLYTNIYKDCVMFALLELQRVLDEPQEQWAINLKQQVEALGADLSSETELSSLNSIAQRLLDSRGMRKVALSYGK